MPQHPLTSSSIQIIRQATPKKTVSMQVNIACRIDIVMGAQSNIDYCIVINIDRQSNVDPLGCPRRAAWGRCSGGEERRRWHTWTRAEAAEKQRSGASRPGAPQGHSRSRRCQSPPTRIYPRERQQVHHRHRNPSRGMPRMLPPVQPPPTSPPQPPGLPRAKK